MNTHPNTTAQLHAVFDSVFVQLNQIFLNSLLSTRIKLCEYKQRHQIYVSKNYEYGNV